MSFSPECGAAVADGSTCRAMFDALLAHEYEFPASFGAVHHLTVYELMHRLLLTGDLIFVGKVGGTRSDDDARTEWLSLQRVLATFPNDATVWRCRSSCHGAGRASPSGRKQDSRRAHPLRRVAAR